MYILYIHWTEDEWKHIEVWLARTRIKGESQKFWKLFLKDFHNHHHHQLTITRMSVIRFKINYLYYSVYNVIEFIFTCMKLNRLQLIHCFEMKFKGNFYCIKLQQQNVTKQFRSMYTYYSSKSLHEKVWNIKGKIFLNGSTSVSYFCWLNMHDCEL